MTWTLTARIVRLATGLSFALAAHGAIADTPLKKLSMRHELLGFEAVGRLDFPDGFCSAALIAPDLVLTAAHCLIDTRTGERRDPRKTTFRAGIRDGDAIAERAGLRAVAHPDFDVADENLLRRLTSDIALMQLAEPIPAGVAAPFAVDAAPGEGAPVSVVSYARERQSAPSWQRRCSVLRQSLGAMEMSCESNFGASGAPVFDLSSGRPRIVSVLSQKAMAEGEHRVWGMEAATSVGDLKTALRAGRGVWPQRAQVAPRQLTVGSGTTRTSDGGARFVRP